MDKNIDSTQTYYLTYDVENRIKHDQAHCVEFLLTMDVLGELFSHLDPVQATAADIGCGTGNYSVEVAPYVSRLYACDLMPNLLEQLSAKVQQYGFEHIIPVCGNAEHLPAVPDGSCDITLCMGPLYHLCEEGSRARCLNELKRITKPKGQVVITYLNPRALWANIARGKLTVEEFERLETQDRVLMPPFYFTSPTLIEKELATHGFTPKKHVALDAFTSFLLDEVNRWDSSAYNSWLRIVRRHKEDPAWLAFSSHGLIVAEVDR